MQTALLAPLLGTAPGAWPQADKPLLRLARDLSTYEGDRGMIERWVHEHLPFSSAAPQRASHLSAETQRINAVVAAMAVGPTEA